MCDRTTSRDLFSPDGYGLSPKASSEERTESFSGHRAATEAEGSAGPARRRLRPGVCGPSRRRAGPSPRRAGRQAPRGGLCAAPQPLRRARARAAEGEPRWGRRRRGGGGSRAAAAAAPVGEERRRLELLWRRTRGGGSGDPPLSTWTVAEASADAFAPGRGGQTAVAAAAAQGAEGPGGRLWVAETSPPRRGGCGHFTARDRGKRICVLAFFPPLPAGPPLGEASRAAWAGGGWVVAGREAPGPGSAVAAVAARVRPAGPEPAQAAGLAARPRTGPGSRRLLCRPVRTRQRRPPHGRVLGAQPCGGYPPAARPLIPANAAAAAAAAVWAMD